MYKRIFSFTTAFCLCLGLLSAAMPRAHAESTRITERSAISGSDFTDSPALAEKLDAIFDGNASIYRDPACTKPVNTELGTSPVRNNGVYMYVDPVDGVAKSIGTSCWIYANGVYYTLFGESTGRGVGENSEKLKLSGTGSRTLSYQNLKAWGVRQGVGALIRANGHSMIVLGYDENSLTILDGNSNGRGLVSVSRKGWDRYGGYVEYIIQPKDAHYSELFACGACGEDTVWAVDESGTLILSGAGKITYPGWREYNDRIEKVLIRDPIELGNGVFYNCENLKEIVFQSSAPSLSEDAFLGITATVRYPATKYGWNKDFLQSYGGDLTWEPYGMTELRIINQPQGVCTYDGQTAEVSVEVEGDGLSYSWYLKKPEESVFVKSSFSGPVCTVTMAAHLDGTQLVCVVKDQYGNYAVTQPAFLRICEDDHRDDHPEVSNLIRTMPI